MTKNTFKSVARRVLPWGIWALVLAGVSDVIGAEWHGLAKMGLLRYDYAYFYYAFQVVSHHQPAAQLYTLHMEQAFLAKWQFPYLPYNQYVYPPQFALFWSFFGRLPFITSATMWMAMSAILYALGTFLLAKMLWPRLTRTRLLLLAMMAVLMTPFQIDLGVGNVNSILFAALALSFYLLYHRHSPWWAGVPLGLAIAFKVTPVAILVYLLLRRQWRAAVSTVLTTALLSGLTAFQLGNGILLRYAQDFLTFGQTSMKNGPAPYNQSLLGVFGMFVQHHWLTWSTHVQYGIFLAFAVGVAGVVLWISQRLQASDWDLDIAVASLTPLLFSPLVEEMHMIFALPTILVLGQRAREAFAAGTGRSRITGTVLASVILGTSVILSLPVTFALNYIVNHWATLFWVHMQMFLVLLILFFTVTWQSLGHRPGQKKKEPYSYGSKEKPATSLSPSQRVAESGTHQV